MTSLKRSVIKSKRSAVRQRAALRLANFQSSKRTPTIDVLLDKVMVAQNRQFNAETRLRNSGNTISRKKLLELRKKSIQSSQLRLSKLLGVKL